MKSKRNKLPGEKHDAVIERRGRIWRLLAKNPAGLTPEQVTDKLRLNYCRPGHRVPDAGADSEGETLTPYGCFCSWTFDP
jgi:hypothetical protein